MCIDWIKIILKRFLSFVQCFPLAHCFSFLCPFPKYISCWLDTKTVGVSRSIGVYWPTQIKTFHLDQKSYRIIAIATPTYFVFLSFFLGILFEVLKRLSFCFIFHYLYFLRSLSHPKFLYSYVFISHFQSLFFPLFSLSPHLIYVCFLLLVCLFLSVFYLFLFSRDKFLPFKKILIAKPSPSSFFLSFFLSCLHVHLYTVSYFFSLSFSFFQSFCYFPLVISSSLSIHFSFGNTELKLFNYFVFFSFSQL